MREHFKVKTRICALFSVPGFPNDQRREYYKDTSAAKLGIIQVERTSNWVLVKIWAEEMVWSYKAHSTVHGDDFMRRGPITR